MMVYTWYFAAQSTRAFEKGLERTLCVPEALPCKQQGATDLLRRQTTSRLRGRHPVTLQQRCYS